ncbi:prolipoprotein diacylglyceryl transferase family protein [Desulfocicer niacini]
MDQFIFIFSIGLVLGVSIWWGVKHLPGEKWQILAVIPGAVTSPGKRRGLNLTYYGVLSANAYTFAVFIFLILTTSSGLPLAGTATFIVLLLAVCMPASSLVARIVEKKSGTLTVGGAVFVGMLASPFLIWLMNMIPALTKGTPLNATLMLSAISIAYAFGEGLGRLACLSFGCCYGKPLDHCSPWMQRVMKKQCLVFHGKTKKIAYASGLDGKKVIPIQVITAIIYCISALAGTLLFLNCYFGAALVETLVITQAWRIVSEFFRADFRGNFKITPYQVMAAATVIFALCITMAFPENGNTAPVLYRSMAMIGSPWTILAMEGIWLVSFVFTGRSSVTGAEISFHVQEDKI